MHSARKPALLATLLGLMACNEKPSPTVTPEPSAVTQPVVAAAQAPEPEPPKVNLFDAIKAVDKYGDAWAIASEHNEDTVDELNRGAYLMAYWLAAHPAAGAALISMKDTTSVKKAHKDINAERGGSLCVRARVAQIRRETELDLPIFSGLLMTGDYKHVSFIAAGSTGELVEGDYGRFCGVLMSLYSFSNVSGGQTQSVLVSGVFDLPENRSPK